MFLPRYLSRNFHKKIPHVSPHHFAWNSKPKSHPSSFFSTLFKTLYFNSTSLLPRMIAANSHFVGSVSLGLKLKPKNPSVIRFCFKGFESFNLGFPAKHGEIAVSENWKRMDFLLGKMGIGGCFKEPMKKGKKVEVESVDGGEDVFDAAVAEGKVFPDHLVVMVNGLIGSAADWRFAAEQFVKKLPDKVVVHRSECNYSRLTFDGVDLMGERLAEEVLAVVRRRPKVHKISFVAHSLGGLVARYAVGRLYEPSPKLEPSDLPGKQPDEETSNKRHHEQQSEPRIAGLVPMNFITFATPHLGSRGHRQLPFLCGLPFLERKAPQTAHWIVGRSGKHLFLTDNDDGRPPLLLQMVKDSDDLKFISALGSFKRRVVYANANYDHVVGWRTSSIRRQQELPKSNLLVKDEHYPHIVYVERVEAGDKHKELSSFVEDKKVDMEEDMIRGLNQVPWDRVDVSFHKSSQRYIAHNTIQVKTYWLNSDGADVVFHMIDNFLL